MAKTVVVSATNLVRRFGDYARTALTDPVQIAQHGQVRLALVNSDLIGTLPNGSGGGNGDQARLGAKFDILFDAVESMITLVDSEATVIRINALARRYFELAGEEAAGRPLASLLSPPETRSIPAAVLRVVASGQAEDFFLDAKRYPGRTLRARILPFPGGAILFADDVTDTMAAARKDAVGMSLECALDLAGVGEGTINLRGVIEQASDGLALLTGADGEKLRNVRLSSLFSVRHRDAVVSLVERALSDGEHGATTCELLTEQGPAAVCLSIAPVATLERGARATFVVKPI